MSSIQHKRKMPDAAPGAIENVLGPPRSGRLPRSIPGDARREPGRSGAAAGNDDRR
ncbi:hypothetical protein BURPS1106B_A0510 [Burkholderia pseudomallei 1106b]|uniref:Uncharacterized protein n=2 Tax=Burkholderia pseudomallei TaxID=28450 RepID=A0A0E1WBU6_BURPE|nr:hypothetical protein BURPS1106A_1255 [Burkholderia pseudomallei 1106a]EEC36831.1 conserved hypothetical protein [Burkholderia pseudomallei 576]EES27536.1 hypothetical protein BURPS1106B_A0510 [Burkholderia pseudomallei 1106b]EET09816.1 hypothetical protein BURPS1710A_1572 [Burkholderia pseudomallei 1710a]